MITRVYLRNWKSHTETELTFSEGVNVLVGEMGAGKSSVLEAITFALYGTTPALQSRKITLDNLLRRVPTPAKEAVVELDFERDGATYTVRRELKQGSNGAKTDTSELRKDGELIEAPQTSEVTEKIEQILDIDYDMFARTIYAEQNQLDYFLTLRAGERKKKVDELLQLDRFETARKTLVTVVNRLNDRRKDREQELETLQDELDEAAVEELQEQQEEQREQLEQLQEEQDELVEKHETVVERLEALQEQKEQFESLQEQRTKLETRIESLEERIEELADTTGELAELDNDAVIEHREEIEEEQDELAETQDDIEELEKQLSVLQDRKEQCTKQIETLEEQVEKLEELEEIREQLEEQQETLEELKSKEQDRKTRLQEAKKSLQNLAKASETCPTCGQELTDEHRTEYLQEMKEQKAELSEEIETIQEQKNDVSETVADLEDKKENLLQYTDAGEELEEKQETLDKLTEKIEQKQELLEEKQEAYDADRVEALDAELATLEKVSELNAVRKKLEKQCEALEEVEEQIEDAEYDEETFEAVREKKNAVEKKRDVLQTDIENKQELVQEREKRLEELEQKQERIEEYKEQAAAYREKQDMLNTLMNALETTQVELRQQFIDSVNEMMADLWQQIYPYDGYSSIRLNAEDGYALELQDHDGNWIPVEGEVSGGERHSAALTLRIALAILLAPSWRLLVLDEPTHNLDVTAIEDLAETLRTDVSEIVGQLFLITHEERLETAVTGDLYKLSKKDSDAGLTQVEPVTGEQ